MAMVNGAHRVRAAVIRRVQVGDQVTNGGSHDQQVTRSLLTWIPVCVRNYTWRTCRSSRLDLYDLVAQLERERAFQDIPRLVVFVMHMQWRDGARWARRRAWRQA